MELTPKFIQIIEDNKGVVNILSSGKTRDPVLVTCARNVLGYYNYNCVADLVFR